jgi:uncharacterized circularly permuted ATP-grasp superfamily protein
MYRAILYFFLLCALSSASAYAAEAEDAALAAASARAKANAGKYYDEIFDSDGNIRPQYEDIYPLYLKKSPEELAKLRRETMKDFRGDNALSGLPRVMTQEEFDFVKKGVAQRGKALLLFLQDHYSGKKTYLKDGVIPESVVRNIVARSGEAGFEGKIDPDLIRFMYGPDIIRDADGVYRVLEDNTAFLGGQGDLKIAKESLFKHMPEIKEVFSKEPTTDPMSFYRDLLSRYKSEMKNPQDRIVVFAIPPYPDKEDYRLQEIWKELGVDWVTPKGPKRLVKKPDGVYLETQAGGRKQLKKVGYVIFNTEFYAADPTFAANREQLLLREATEQLSYRGKDALPDSVRKGLERALKPDPSSGKPDLQKVENILKMNSPHAFNPEKGSVPGLLEAIASGQVLSNNTPGTEFINDKEFNMYVEDLIRHYLHEEPILRNLPTERLYTTNGAGERVVNEAAFDKLEKNWDQYVVKVVDGRGGDGVWVGPKLSAEERKQLLARLRSDTSRETITQAYRHPSVLGNDIVDLRVLSQVGYGGKANLPDVYVPNIGWSRAVEMAGDGKVNLSAGSAHEVTFIVRQKLPQSGAYKFRPGLSDCPALFKGL